MQLSQKITIQAYQLRKGGTPARLTILRKIAAASVDNVNPSTRLNPDDWRAALHYTLGSYESSYCAGLGQGAGQWYTHQGEQFRNEQDARENGYYTDCDGSERAFGIVGALPHSRFIAGFRWESNGERVYFAEVFEDIEDARRMAMEHARVFAESAIEHDERFDRMARAESDVEDKTLELQKALYLRDNPKLGGRAEAREALQALRDARDALRDATREYEGG